MGSDHQENSNQEKVGARDDGSWGPCDIIKKTVEIYRSQSCLFSTIQLAIVFPTTIVWLLNQYYFRKFAHDHWPKPPCSDPCPPASQFDLADDPSPCNWKVIAIVIGLFLLAFILLINTIGAVYVAVGAAYSGKKLSFKEVISALCPLWKGLALTILLGYLFFFLASIAIALVGWLLKALASATCLPVPIVFLLTISVGAVIVFFVGTTTKIAYAISVYEKVSGSEAFCKALDLLKQKWCVAFGIAVIYFVPFAILTAVVHKASLACAGQWAKIFFVGIIANLLAIVWQLALMTYALFYYSAKQSKNQSIPIDHLSYCLGSDESGYHLVNV